MRARKPANILPASQSPATVHEVTPFYAFPKQFQLIQNKMYVGLDGNSSFSSLGELGDFESGNILPYYFSLDNLARSKPMLMYKLFTE